MQVKRMELNALKGGFAKRLRKDIVARPTVYIFALIVMIYYILFHYLPMSGLVIAFQNYKPSRGIWGSDFIGLTNFIDFIDSRSFPAVIFNTLILNGLQLLFNFPAPIIFALLLNEVRSVRYKRTIQTVSYMPHFLSLMVMCGMLVDFCRTDGLFNQIGALFGAEPTALLSQSKYYRTIYVGSGIWQELGYSSIIFLSALTGIDQQLYDAASIDGANRFQKMIHVSLPGIAATVVIMLIMRIGKMMSLGFEKTILLYNASTYDVADIISSFVYRRGLLDLDYGFGAAVDLFNSIVNFSLLIFANSMSRKVTGTSLY